MSRNKLLTKIMNSTSRNYLHLLCFRNLEKSSVYPLQNLKTLLLWLQIRLQPVCPNLEIPLSDEQVNFWYECCLLPSYIYLSPDSAGSFINLHKFECMPSMFNMILFLDKTDGDENKKEPEEATKEAESNKKPSRKGIVG